jgi:polysaccharide chain length determinant protein (PEP-CTERM system associated)
LTKQLTLQDYLGIAKRRKLLLIIPPLVLAVVGFALTFVLKPKYTSSTLVLVEGQKVATTLVAPAVTEDLNERLLTMKQQILSRSRLEPIMQKFGLYKDDLNKRPMEDLIDEMRSNIQVDTIHGAKEGSTTGFYISFTADNPKLAQDVCAEITSLFMEENLKQREETAVGTTDFLASQLADSKRNLDEQDAKLAAFERKYMGQLPGEQTVNVAMLNNLRTQLDGVTQALNRAQQDKLYTESLLAQQTAAMRSTQGSPDSLPAKQVDDQLKTLKQNLVTLEAKYTPQHPDVIKTKEMIANLEKSQQESAAEEKKQPAPASKPEKQEVTLTPEMQHLRDNIHALEVTIREKSPEQARLQQEIRQYEGRLELTPAVEEQYKQLTRDYQTAQQLYDDLLKKKSESEMSSDLEKRQEGEQFRIVDPANLPEKPSFPDKLMFLGGGFAAGLGLGAALAFLFELSQKAVHGESDIEFYLKLPVIVSVPVIAAEQENSPSSRRGRWLRRKHATDDVVDEELETQAVGGGR